MAGCAAGDGYFHSEIDGGVWNIRVMHGETSNIRGLDVGCALERRICGLYLEYAVERLGGRGWLAVRQGMPTSIVK